VWLIREFPQTGFPWWTVIICPSLAQAFSTDSKQYLTEWRLSFLSWLEIWINKCNQNIAVPTGFNIPKPNRFKVLFVNVSKITRTISESSSNASAESIEKAHGKTDQSSLCLLTRSQVSHVTCHIACLNIRYQFTDRDMPLQKIKWGSHFGFLTGMWIFQNITFHKDTNSWEPQAKIRLAFHFVERKYR